MRTQSRTSRFVLMFFLVFGSMGHAMAFSGPDKDSLKSVLFDLSGRQLTLPLPTKGLSSDIDGKPFVTSVDLDNLPGQGPLMMVDELWDWRGFFWKGVAGSLAIKLSVENAPNGVSLRCEESMRQVLTAQFAHEKEEFIRLGGQPKYMSSYVFDAHSYPISGFPALAFRERGLYVADFYVMPITDRAYIRFGFIFLRNGGDQNWMAEAMSLETAILGKIHLNEDWLRMEPCPTAR